MDDSLKKLTDKLNGELKNIDEVVHHLLKGHLIIEELLGEINSQFCFNKKYMYEAKLSFNQKAKLARSYCVRQHVSSQWKLISLLNSLRNELAHNLESERRHKKLEELRAFCIANKLGSDDFDESLLQNDAALVSLACAGVIGFLGHYLEDAKAYREIIYNLDREWNAEKEPFPRT